MGEHGQTGFAPGGRTGGGDGPGPAPPLERSGDLTILELDAQRRVLELVAMGAPLGSTLETLARLLEEQSAGMVCSILLAGDDGETFRHGAAPSLPPAYARAVEGREGRPARPFPAWPVGGDGVVAADIASDPGWEGYREVALRHGLRACWSVAIRSSAGDVVGAFVVYYRQARGQDPADHRLVGGAAHLAGIAIGRAREEARREASERRYAELVAGLEAIVWEGDAQTYRPTFMSPRVEEVLGYPVAWWLDDPECWRRAIHPDDCESTVAACRAAVAERRDHVLEYRMVASDGRVRRFEDLVRVVCDREGTPRQVRGVLVDVTERREEARAVAWAAEEKRRLEGALLVARTVAHEVNNALAPLAGYAELLRAQPGGPRAATYAALIGTAVEALAERVARLQRIVRVETTAEPLGPGLPLLDLERSTADGYGSSGR